MLPSGTARLTTPRRRADLGGVFERVSVLQAVRLGNAAVARGDLYDPQLDTKLHLKANRRRPRPLEFSTVAREKVVAWRRENFEDLAVFDILEFLLDTTPDQKRRSRFDGL
jgi:hypothetical protein